MKELKEFKVLVAGSGTMGSSIAQVFAAAGHQVYLSHRKEGTSMAGAKVRIQEAIDGLIREGLATEDYRAAVAANLHYITNDEIPAIGKDLDIVFESIFEDPEVKRKFYAVLDQCCRADCILASNTSGMDIFSVCDGVLSDPQRLVVAHWFNPPHLMKLVEVVRGPKTSDETVQTVVQLLESVGRKPAVLNHFVPGFIVNRLATVICRELYYMVEQGWISAEDAERAIRYSNGLRFSFEGPLALWDFVGLDLTVAVARGVLPTLCNDTDKISLGEKLVARGETGAKAGQGMLHWDDVAAYNQKRSRRIIQMTKVIEQFDQEDAADD